MASTNKTTNYQLSQFQSSDIPAWLTDYNGDMQKIDAGIHAAKTQADGAASGVSLLQTAVSGKQDKLDFDTSPIAGSTNPVTSGGIYNALQNAQIQTDAVPTEGSTKAVQSGGVYTALSGKQDTLTFDSEPTQDSRNPVTSGGVYSALKTSGINGAFLPSGGAFSGANYIGNNQIIKFGNLIIYAQGGDSEIKNKAASWDSFTSGGLTRAWSSVGSLAGNPFNLQAANDVETAIATNQLIKLCSLRDLDSTVFYSRTGECFAFYDGNKTCVFYSIVMPSQTPGTNAQIVMPMWATLVT